MREGGRREMGREGFERERMRETGREGREMGR